MTAPLFLGHDIYRQSSYGPRHPLAIQRIPLVLDLARALHWLPDDAYVESPMATPRELRRFHTADYIAALREAEAAQRVTPEITARHNIGKLENPIYPEMFRRPSVAAGGSLWAARHLAARDAGVIYHPAGGTHHARPDRGAGFCFFNDPVLAILTLLDAGIAPIAYVDLDLHHGDGVEAAFEGDARVLCLSVHEAGKWPHSGRAEDRAGGSARNFPVPPPMNDSELDWLLHQAMVPLVQGHRPAALFIQAGADALADDPLGNQNWSNRALWRAVATLVPLAPRVIVTGGGGYNPWAVARAWTGIWGTLTGQALPAALPPQAEGVLRAITWHRAAGRNPPAHWFTTLADEPNEGPVRDNVKRLADLALAG